MLRQSQDYDALGRVTEDKAEDFSGIFGSTIRLSTTQYDAAGNRVMHSVSIDGNADYTNTYTYDPLQRLITLQQNGNGVASKRANFTYNALGQTTFIVRREGTSNIVTTAAYTYDDANRLTSIKHGIGTSSTNHYATYGYTYDAADRITSINSLVDGVSNYTYDHTGQLTTADHSTITDETYSYDENGNRTMTGYDIDPNNELRSDGTWNYTYDFEGNRTSKVSIATGDRVDYEWDYRNRLTKVTFKDSSGNVTKTVTQTYDINNRWVRSEVDTNGPAAGGVSQRVFIYDGNQVVLEFDGTSGTDISHRYLWAPGIDHLLSDEQVTTVTTAGNTIWPMGDHLNTARDLVDYNGASTPATVNHRQYNSYGELVDESNAAVDLIFGFTGRMTDENTGLNNHLWRWYDEDIAQWLSEDPEGFAAGDPNLNRYVSNQPIGNTDPSGLQRVPNYAQRGSLPPQFNRTFIYRDPQSFRQASVDSSARIDYGVGHETHDLVFEQLRVLERNARRESNRVEMERLRQLRERLPYEVLNRLMESARQAGMSSNEIRQIIRDSGHTGNGLPTSQQTHRISETLCRQLDEWARLTNSSSTSPLPWSYINSRFTINMAGAPAGSRPNAAGYPRNGHWFWRQMLSHHPELFSETNRTHIANRRSPVIDDAWVALNPTHRSFMGDTLIHHHINQGGIATGLPQRVHRAWHGVLHPDR